MPTPEKTVTVTFRGGNGRTPDRYVARFGRYMLTIPFRYDMQGVETRRKIAGDVLLKCPTDFYVITGIVSESLTETTFSVKAI
jgi:hypothetical protein